MLKTAVYFCAGAALTFGYLVAIGPITIDLGGKAGDLIANALGALLGSAGAAVLAVYMFRHQRQVKVQDDAEALIASRKKEIRDALRHIRSIRECVHEAAGLEFARWEDGKTTIGRICSLANSKRNEDDFTDMPLRQAMHEAVSISLDLMQKIKALIGVKTFAPDDIVPGSEAVTSEALAKLDAIIASYTARRLADFK